MVVFTVYVTGVPLIFWLGIVQVIVARLKLGCMRCIVECTPINILQLLLAHDPLSSLVYRMITYTHPTASNLPIKTLVAKQQPTNIYLYSSTRRQASNVYASHNATFHISLGIIMTYCQLIYPPCSIVMAYLLPL